MSGLKLFSLGTNEIATDSSNTTINGISEISNTNDFKLSAGTSLFFETNGTEVMTITPDSKVGVGTSVPSEKLEVDGNNVIFKNSGANDNLLYIEMNNHSNGVDLEATAATSATKKNITLCAYGGNVGIGTPSPNVDLDVSGVIEAKNSAGNVRGALNPNNGTFLTIECFDSGNTIKYPVCLDPYSGGGPTGGVTVNWPSATSYAFYVNGLAGGSGSWTTSDDRIKYNEEIISGVSALAMVNQLEPQYYEKIIQTPSGVSGNWIPTDAEWPSVKDNYVWDNEAGLIAQDVRAIPGLSFSVTGQEVDAEGTQTPLHLNYNDIYAYHIAATKELSSQLTAEKAKTATLETKVTNLEAQVLDLIIRVTQLENP